ncbi:MAG: MFS transporter [Candidatus Omnitrophica bacterium]|nr:MFS transporter [Candidatus Omnitrophota bacterium]
MADSRPPFRFFDALTIPEVRWFLGAVASFTLAGRALMVIIGYQVYRLTHDPAALGWLGLVEAIPAISLVLFGGHVADHVNRRAILLVTRAVSTACALALAAVSWRQPAAVLPALYGVVFLAGTARGFADPAHTAFEAQIVPKHLTVNASSWISSTWIGCAVLGPAIIGFVFDAWGAAACYLLSAVGFAGSWLCTAAIAPKPTPVQAHREPLLKSIGIGWRFVFANPALLGAMALDLFAVLFGGMIALLPVYADDILHVGAKGVGLLNAASACGALTITLLATHRPPIARAGRNLLLAVAGFGLSVLVFAFSTNFWLSMAALWCSGACDGVSMVIRRSMVRLLSPDHLRGRIAAANWVFISASNELGAFESGMVAAWIGTVPCVALGGLTTLGVVALAATLSPHLRRLQFDVRTLERRLHGANEL